MTKIAIAPGRGARLVRLFRHPFWHIFARGSRHSRAISFIPAVSAAVDTFYPLYHHHPWYVCSPDSMRHLYVLCIV